MYLIPAVLSQKRHKSGFTLIELLIVIAIISVLMTAGAIGIGGMTGGKGVSSAVATTESMFDEARAIAVSKRTKARVLVDISDPTDSPNYLRRILVAYNDLDKDGNPETDWTISSRGLNLPEQTYFSQDYSIKDHQNSGGRLDEMTIGAEARENLRGKYLYYEFNGEGIATTPGASFIVGTGVRPGNAEKPKVTGSAKRDFGGFVVWRNGRTSLFRSPEQMGLPAQVTNF